LNEFGPPVRRSCVGLPPASTILRSALAADRAASSVVEG
jgi:hypothetical protein